MANVVIARPTSRSFVEPLMGEPKRKSWDESSCIDGQSESGSKRRHDQTDWCPQQPQPHYFTVKDSSNVSRFRSSQMQRQRRNQMKKKKKKQRSRIQRWTVPTACCSVVLMALSSPLSLSPPSYSFPIVFGYPQTTHQHQRPLRYLSSSIHRYIIDDDDDDRLRESAVFERRSLMTSKLHLSHRRLSRDAVWTFIPTPGRPYCGNYRNGGISRLAAASSSSSSSASDSEDDEKDDKITNVTEPIPPLEVVQSPQSSKSETENDVQNNSNNNGKASLSPIEKLDRRLAKLEAKYVTRISRLEEIVSRQEVELHKLRKQCAELGQVSKSFADLLNLLRESPSLNPDGTGRSQSSSSSTSSSGSSSSSSNVSDVPSSSPSSSSSSSPSSTTSRKQSNGGNQTVIESFDDAMIFGRAPSSVIDAADAAGAAILSGMLGGKQRMLVDVRDAELSSDPETLVQFIELSILPVAAGLEGLKSTRNRVKIVFPKVSQLLEYRRTMALAAPEVVALSTLDFDPVEDNDKLVVVVAPEPDDDEGIDALKNLLAPVDSTDDPNERQPIQQPVVLLNYHMHPPPVSGLEEFETAYHLRLLTVQYMSATAAEQYMKQIRTENDNEVDDALEQDTSNDSEVMESSNNDVSKGTGEVDIKNVDEEDNDDEEDDDELESAVKHAHDVGMNQGTTRAMVIRAYPRPWHVFVDVSPDTDADFEVAATFDDEPTSEELNMAIVECLEGSEREDEIVAQQMQQALEEGQLDHVSDMISKVLSSEDDDSDDDGDDDDFYIIEEDSV